jgi:phage terminase large subunit-like protein
LIPAPRKPPAWSTACRDWEARLARGDSLIPFDPLFPDEAQAALEVFAALRIVDMPGSPRAGEVARAWVTSFAGAIFGSYDSETGRRLIREFFLLISKKNGKSTIAALIMLTALIRNWRQSAELYILAPTIEIANNSFYAARDAVRAEPELADLLQVQEHIRKITHRATGAFLKVVAADAETVSGKKTAGLLIDEYWLFGRQARAESMIAEAAGGLASRPEGFVIMLSTQSDEPPAGVFKAKLDYFRQVRDGSIVDPKSLPVLYEFPPSIVREKSYMRPENWRLTNPNLGLSVDTEWLADEHRKAEAAGASALNIFLAKHLNVEIGQALRADRWPGADYWQAASDPSLTLESLIARSEVITIGIDGGGLDDLLGVAVLGREAESKRWLAWCRAFVRVAALRRRKGIAAELIDFAVQRDLVVVDNNGPIEPGDIVVAMQEQRPADFGAEGQFPAESDQKAPIPADIAGVVDICARVDASGLLAQVGLDPVGVGMIVDALDEAGIGDKLNPDASRVVSVHQGYKLMGAIHTLGRKLEDGTLAHAEQPLMAFCVGNAKCEVKGNALMITKQLAGAAKIDPLMALFDAVALMSQNPEPMGSVYSADRGILFFG